MLLSVQQLILDDDRRLNAQRFNEQFYGAKAIKDSDEPVSVPQFETVTEIPEQTERPKTATAAQETPAEPQQPNAELIQKLLANPEMLNLLQSLAGKL